MAPFPSELAFEWSFLGVNGKKKAELRTAKKALELTDKLHYAIPDERAFGKIVCSAQAPDEESLQGLDKPCIFQIIPKDLPYLESCNVMTLNEKWITVECVLKDDSEINPEEFEFWQVFIHRINICHYFKTLLKG